MNPLKTNQILKLSSSVVTFTLAIAFLSLQGCVVAQPADLKYTERSLQQKIKQQDDQLSQTRARQSQEISNLRDQDLPQLRGELEKTRHQAEELQSRQEDLKHRAAQLEQLAKRLERLDGSLVERLDSLDVVNGKILLRIEELEKRLPVLEKR